jgi:hypothetical protein
LQWTLIGAPSAITYETVDGSQVDFTASGLTQNQELVLAAKYINAGSDSNAVYGPDGEVYLDLIFADAFPVLGGQIGYQTIGEQSSLAVYLNDFTLIKSKNGSSYEIPTPRIVVPAGEEIVLKYSIFANLGASLYIKPKFVYGE